MHSSILTWQIPRTEEPGGVQSLGSKESDTTEHPPTHIVQSTVVYCLYFKFLLMYYFYEKNYKPITVQYYPVDCVSRIPRLTLSDLQTCSWNRTHPHVEDLLCLLLPPSNVFPTVSKSFFQNTKSHHKLLSLNFL